MTADPPRKKRTTQTRSLLTQEAILEAAAAVFDENGFSGAAVSMILERSGGRVSKGALYHHFPSKEAMARKILETQVPMSTLPPQASKIQELVDTSFYFVHLLLTNPLARAGARLSTDGGLPPDLDPGMVFRDWAQHAEFLVRQAMELGEALPGIDPAEISEVLVGAYVGIQLTSHALDGRKELPRKISLFWQLTLPGIATPGLIPGIKFSPERMHYLFPPNAQTSEETDAS
ncbi:ScbR family autoregulator-binding transcription factor [Streptomyces microflavus]|uniref:ScbR family autoregulator-binding transcription factor n=1 Tax=Streptomyces microflavus TaxID=1919 RepID=UPI003812036E